MHEREKEIDQEWLGRLRETLAASDVAPPALVVLSLLENGWVPEVISRLSEPEQGALLRVLATTADERAIGWLKTVLAAGANPDARGGQRQETALMSALLARGGNPQAVAALLALSDPRLADLDGNTALCVACSHESPNVEWIEKIIARAAAVEKNSPSREPRERVPAVERSALCILAGYSLSESAIRIVAPVCDPFQMDYPMSVPPLMSIGIERGSRGALEVVAREMIKKNPLRANAVAGQYAQWILDEIAQLRPSERERSEMAEGESLAVDRIAKRGVAHLHCRNFEALDAVSAMGLRFDGQEAAIHALAGWAGVEMPATRVRIERCALRESIEPGAADNAAKSEGLQSESVQERPPRRM